MVCFVLAKSNIVCKSWLEKPVEEMEAKLWKARPPESFWLNKSACDDAERAYYEKLSGYNVDTLVTGLSSSEEMALVKKLNDLEDLGHKND
jgi:hypothetical protein